MPRTVCRANTSRWFLSGKSCRSSDNLGTCQLVDNWRSFWFRLLPKIYSGPGQRRNDVQNSGWVYSWAKSWSNLRWIDPMKQEVVLLKDHCRITWVLIFPHHDFPDFQSPGQWYSSSISSQICQDVGSAHFLDNMDWWYPFQGPLYLCGLPVPPLLRAESSSKSGCCSRNVLFHWMFTLNGWYDWYGW